MLFTKEEKYALSELRSRVKNIYSEPDERLIAWLRARELNVEKAEQMLRRHLVWRKNNEIDKLKTWRSPKCFFPAIHSGHDYERSPVFIMPIGRWELRSAIETGDIVPALRYIYQALELIVGAALDNGVYQGIVVLDFDGFGYRQIAHRTVLQGILEVLKIFESNYPEVLKHSFVINAPKIFNALFNIVKPLLNSRTLAKVQIFNSDKPRWKEALLKIIPEDQLPPHWGGTMKGTDEYCSDAWFFEPMPKYFMRKASSAVDEFGEDWFSIKVAAREQLTLEYEVSEKVESTLKWAFTTDGYDIGFSIKHEDDKDYVVPYCRADAHLAKQEGVIRLNRPGKYIMTFDNSYSRARAKVLNYSVQLTQVDPTEKYNLINNNNNNIICKNGNEDGAIECI